MAKWFLLCEMNRARVTLLTDRHYSIPLALEVSSDGKTLALQDRELEVELWDIDTRERICKLTPNLSKRFELLRSPG